MRHGKSWSFPCCQTPTVGKTAEEQQVLSWTTNHYSKTPSGKFKTDRFLHISEHYNSYGVTSIKNTHTISCAYTPSGTTHKKTHFTYLFSYRRLMTSNGKKNHCHPFSIHTHTHTHTRARAYVCTYAHPPTHTRARAHAHGVKTQVTAAFEICHKVWKTNTDEIFMVAINTDSIISKFFLFLQTWQRMYV
jgi:hypothetical protein